MKTVLDLTAPQARIYFLESKNYCNIDLPKYFTFQKILNKISTKLKNSELKSFYRLDPATGKVATEPNDIDGLNHSILGNKDGHFAWRSFELIHPALYVDLVHLITSEDNWKYIQARFKIFKTSNVKCVSLPQVTTTRQTHKAEQIKAWWEHMEQEAIVLGLDFQYIFDADITDCYGSIYTHSVAWALHGKISARGDRSDHKLLGSKIDDHLQRMRYRQTNGIPQGSVLSDFIAEIVLGYVDLKLSEKLKSMAIPKTRYKILRYRDDYKIFTNQPHIGREVLKCLSETLAELGLRLNTAKTKENADPILGSVKEDKIDEMFVPNKHDNFSKWLMQIYATLHLHPNSGKSVRQLNTYHDKLLKHKDEDKKLRPYEKPDVMLSVITNLAIRNPKCYNWCAAIQSILLEYCTVARRKTVLNKIIKKFDAVPNTGLLDIWLQRITYPHDPNRAFVESMTEVVTLDAYPDNSQLWKSSWLVDSMKDIVLKTPIIDKNELRKITPIIRRDETALFRPPVPS